MANTYDPYSYLGTDVLVNLLNIHDSKQLQQAEASITNIVLSLIQQKGVTGNYDFNHLKNSTI